MSDLKNKMHKTNFYKRHPKYTILIISIILLITIEFLSGSIIFLSHHFFGTPRVISLFCFHPLFTGVNIVKYETYWAEPYPVFGYVNKINFSDENCYATDKYGFIHNGDKSRIIDKDKFKIFIVGGSTVAGHGASSNSQTIPAHLERLLRQKYPNVQVINAGIPSYYSAKEMLKVSNEIYFFDPDIIIGFGGTNDFRNEYMEEYKGRRHVYFISPYDIELFQTLENTKSIIWSTKNFIHNLIKFTEYTYTRFVLEKGLSFIMGRTGSLAKSDIVTNVKRICNISGVPKQNLQYNDKGFEEEMEKKISYYFAYINQTQALVTGTGKRYYYILQPILFNDIRDFPETEQAALEIARYSFFKKSGMDIVKRARYFWKRVAEKFSQGGIRFYDLTDVFRDKQGYYSDFEHYNDLGNLEIAKKICNILTEDRAVMRK